MRLKDKVAVVIGAGQSQGETLGNGRATVLRFVQEGARVLAVDRDLASADQTCAKAVELAPQAQCLPWQADVLREDELAEALAQAMRLWGRIDILHYNVGISVSGGDASPTEISEAAFDRICAINLRGCVMAGKHVLPIMRRQGGGVILNIASVSAWQRYPWVAYKASKAGMIAYTQQLAIENAEYGVRANAILPGLIDTPMAVDTRAQTFGRSRADVVAERDARVPLRARMGTAWDVANAAVFLASDEAGFITGVELPVDGGALVNIVR
ncbi:3-oxoacyl-ACP reductase [Bordetella genomosp. 5]|uniref:3-oxoacyl-ACP reductase n=1 Tax=Bordetella genomosp. 5 TaxID=1395608 RepID=A0A261TAQ8_9BORD|nr:SDR family NAD(P)-dependent oxidoreductase [Bordetella genomosp. 5]OZI39953.1 3-oxoacyl-ACP reductase [Bordetella genomosp. 5]OZI46714.1 3-oxoacyl-ACP reductase [Bordetella genomosp. 5]